MSFKVREDIQYIEMQEQLSWTKEDRLLLYYCRSEIDNSIKNKIVETERKGIDWVCFLKKAKDNGISAYVYSNLNKNKKSSPNIPVDIYEQLKRDYYLNALKNTLIFTVLGKFLESLKKVGLQVIVLKGGALAETIYGNMAVRPMSDIDLLIKKEDLLSVDKQLNMLGYRPSDISVNDIDFSSAYLTTLDYRSSSKNSISFHIHWHFINSSVPNESYIQNVKIERIWQDAEKACIANGETFVMAPHHLLIHLSEHALRVMHSFNRYSYFCDIDRVIHFYKDRLNWESLIRDSFHFKLDRMVYLSLYFTAVFLNTKIPKDVLLRLKPKRFYLAERVFMSLISRNIRLSGLSYLVHFSQNRGLLKKMKFVGRTLFPPRLIMAQRNFIPLQDVRSRHYLYRIKEVFGIFVRLLKHYIS